MLSISIIHSKSLKETSLVILITSIYTFDLFYWMFRNTRIVGWYWRNVLLNMIFICLSKVKRLRKSHLVCIIRNKSQTENRLSSWDFSRLVDHTKCFSFQLKLSTKIITTRNPTKCCHPTPILQLFSHQETEKRKTSKVNLNIAVSLNLLNVDL